MSEGGGAGRCPREQIVRGNRPPCGVNGGKEVSERTTSLVQNAVGGGPTGGSLMRGWGCASYGWRNICQLSLPWLDGGTVIGVSSGVVDFGCCMSSSSRPS